MMINSEADTYQAVRDITGMSPSDNLMDYIYYSNLLTTSNATILVGVQSAMLNLNPSS